MSKISFWDTLVHDDVSLFEADAINASHDAAEVAQASAESAHQRIERLEQLVGRQRTEVGQLRAAVDTLLHMLAEHGAIDREIFGYRLEAAIENARERAQQAAAMTVCSGCAAQVARASTTITVGGVLCPRCLANG